MFPGIAPTINMHVPCLSLPIMMSCFLSGIVLSVHACWFHNMVTLASWLVSTDFGTWSYRYLLSNFCNNNNKTIIIIILLQGNSETKIPYSVLVNGGTEGKQSTWSYFDTSPLFVHKVIRLMMACDEIF
jgi:hypothetical protein